MIIKALNIRKLVLSQVLILVISMVSCTSIKFDNPETALHTKLVAFTIDTSIPTITTLPILPWKITKYPTPTATSTPTNTITVAYSTIYTYESGSLFDKTVTAVNYLHESNPIIIIGTRNGDIFKSMDFGKEWRLVYHSQNMSEVKKVTSINVNSVNDYIYASIFEDGVLLSKDEGETWELSNNGLDSTQVNILVLDPVDENIIYAGCGDGIYISVDGGNSWYASNKGLEYTWITSIAVKPGKPSTLFVGTSTWGITDSYFSISHDGGNTWDTNIKMGIDNINSIVLDPIRPSRLYLAGDGFVEDG